MRNNRLQIDENFLRVHPDLASLFREVQEKESELEILKAKRKSLKEEIKAAKSELNKRMNALEAWKMKGQTTASKSRTRRRRQAS